MDRVLMLTADSGEGPDVVDGTIVSATGWTDLAQWSRAFMEVLERALVPA